MIGCIDHIDSFNMRQGGGDLHGGISSPQVLPSY
jgi:hypothetical protein